MHFTLIDLKSNRGENEKMIPVTKLDGSTYWINPHMIESMEQNPDLTIAFLSGKKVVVKDAPMEVIDRIVAYRKRVGINALER